MGKLADRFRRFVADEQKIGPLDQEWRDERVAIADRIAELEQRLAGYENGGLVEGRDYSTVATRDPDTGMRCTTTVEALEQHAHTAEQRADALLAAVSEMIRCSARVVGVSEIENTHVFSRTRTVTLKGNDAEFKIGRFVAVFGTPDADAPNPDLLERASVELAEEYIRVKAEQEAK